MSASATLVLGVRRWLALLALVTALGPSWVTLAKIRFESSLGRHGWILIPVHAPLHFVSSPRHPRGEVLAMSPPRYGLPPYYYLTKTLDLNLE